MKRFFLMFPVLLMTLGLFGCGGKRQNEGNHHPSEPTPYGYNEQDPGWQAHSVVQDVFFTEIEGKKVTVRLDPSLELDTETAWLGLVPPLMDYVTESEAEEVCFLQIPPTPQADGEPYRFDCDFTELAEGRYAMVICDSDDDSTGYVVIQTVLIAENDALLFDFSEAKLNANPEG